MRYNQLKIIYYFGQKICSETIVKKGLITDTASQISIIDSNNFTYKLDNLKEVRFVKINALGTMIRLINGNDMIYLSVPRLFIEKGTGFVIINYYATKRLGKMLTEKMTRQ